MRSLTNIFKIIFALSIIFILVLGTGIAYVKKHPIYIDNSKLQKFTNRYAPEYIFESDGGYISYNDGNFILNITKAKLKNKYQQFIQLDNLVHSFSFFTLKSKATANIIDSQLLGHIPIQSDPKLQEMIQKFNMQHKIIFNGKLEANFFFLQLESAFVKLNSSEGIHKPNKNLKQIEIDNIVLDLNLLKNFLEVERFELKYKNNILASLNGDFRFKNNELIAAKFNTHVHNMPIDYLEGFWPSFLFSDIHAWVNQSIYGGIISKAEARFDLTEKDLKSPYVVGKNSLDAEIELNNTNLKFSDNFSPISKIDGIVKIDGHTLNFKSSKAGYLNSTISNSNLNLYFDKMILELNAKISGKVNNFKEFIPQEAIKNLQNHSIEYNKLSGNLTGNLNLTMPIAEDFDIKKLHLHLKTNVDNMSLDKLGVIKIKNGVFEISNETDKFNFTLHHQGKSAFKLSKHHNDEEKFKDYAIIDANIEVSDPFKIKNFNFGQGKIIISADADKTGWKTSLDLTNIEVKISPLNYIKEKGKNFILICSGIEQNEEITSDDCKIKGKEASADISFVYSLKDSELKKLNLRNGILGANLFNFSTSNINKFTLFNLNARYLDFSNFNIDDNESKQQNFITNFNVDKILLKNQTILNKFNGSLKSIAHEPLEINLSGISDSDKISFLKTLKNGKEFYSLYSTSAGLFSNAFGISKSIKKGNLLIEFTPTIRNNEVEYNGQIKANNFYLTNTSILSKIILGILSPLNSPQAMAQSFQGGSLKADLFNANMSFAEGVLTFKDGLISGTSYKIKLEGKVDFNTKTVSFKGIYIPSFYGINTFISMLPLLGKLLAGGDKSAFIAASFSFGGPFENVKTNFNPISILTPGFLRNIFS